METGLATIDTAQVAVIIESAPKALEINKSSVERATSFGQTLLDTIQAEGMNDELDSKCNGYLVKVRTTIQEMNDRRKPITQIMDVLKKEFTSLESELDPKSPNSIYAQIQKSRDEYAAKKIADQRKKEQEAQRKLEQDKEIIRLTSEVSLQLATFFNNYLSNRLRKLNEFYNTISLGVFDSTSHTIENFLESYPHEHFESFAPQIRTVFATPDQVQAIITDCTKGKFGEFNDTFRQAVKEAKHDIMDKLPSRKKELQEIAKAEEAAEQAALMAKTKAQKAAAEAEAQRIAEMKAAADKRAAEDAIRQKQEEDARNAKSASEINTAAQSSMTDALFNAQMTVSEATQATAPVRESYDIEVLNPLGYLLIAQFYFEHEGKTENVAKLEKKTLGAMKTFCEKYAMKNDVKIESAFIKYNEQFKTIAKK